MLLTIDEIEKRLSELQKISVTLDSDPVSQGLVSINKKIAEIQSYKDRTNSLLLEAIKNRHTAEDAFERLKFAHEAEVDKLLATDSEVQNQKSEKLRVAVANSRNPEAVLKLHYAELELAHADSYYKQVQHVYSHLEGVNAALSRQISVIQMSVAVGEISRNDLGDLFGRKMSITK
jgi:SMC interacting uncharacterized protein involved in chromosome segregation